ncbi:MAG: hypothetical protein JW973_16885 [Bacteroidales bacterium]|nr:hypothetical protein [Bacteroidales bacterium]
MKQILLPLMVSVVCMLTLMPAANAQEKQHKKLRFILEEDGKVIKDTAVAFDKTLPEHEVQEILSEITDEAIHPCPAHTRHFVHGDTLIHKCRRMEKGELDSLLEASGRNYTYIRSDSCRHGHDRPGSHVIYIEKVKAGDAQEKDEDVEIILMEKSTGKEPVIIAEGDDIIIIRKKLAPGGKGAKVIAECDADTLIREKIKAIEIIEIENEDIDSSEGTGKKVVKKKIIITEEGDKAEKTIIMESPEKTEKSKQQSK